MEKSQFGSGVCGVGPAESTGKPRSRYWPGGSRPLVSLGFRRPWNPREMNPPLIFSSLLLWIALLLVNMLSRTDVSSSQAQNYIHFTGCPRRAAAGPAFQFSRAV